MQQRSYYLHSNRDTLPGPPCPQVARAAWKSRLAPRDPEGGAGIGGARGPEACGRAKAGAEGRRGGPQPRVLAPGRGRAQVRPRASGFTETARLWGSARRGSRQGGRECLSFPSARGARVSRPAGVGAARRMRSPSAAWLLGAALLLAASASGNHTVRGEERPKSGALGTVGRRWRWGRGGRVSCCLRPPSDYIPQPPLRGFGGGPLRPESNRRRQPREAQVGEVAGRERSARVPRVPTASPPTGRLLRQHLGH